MIDVDLLDLFGKRLTLCKELFSAVDFSSAEFAIVFARWNFYLGLPWSDPYYQPFLLASAQPGESNRADQR